MVSGAHVKPLCLHPQAHVLTSPDLNCGARMPPICPLTTHPWAHDQPWKHPHRPTLAPTHTHTCTRPPARTKDPSCRKTPFWVKL